MWAWAWQIWADLGVEAGLQKTRAAVQIRDDGEPAQKQWQNDLAEWIELRSI